MPNNSHPNSNPLQPLIYQIRIEGHLGEGWKGWFGDMSISPEEGGDTLLSGPLIDQAALYGLLKKVRDLGLTLVSVNRLGPAQEEALDVRESHRSHSNKE